MSRTLLRCRRWALLWAAGAILFGLSRAQAQVTLVSVSPLDGATGVSPSTTVQFTFSAAMNTSATTAFFTDPGFTTFYPITSVWSAGDTVLTCTPIGTFPGGQTISWLVSGSSALGAQLIPPPMGSFTTGPGGGGGGGSGTNAITSFGLGKIHIYDQTNTAAPVLDPVTPYNFSAITSLSSNRTATNVALTLPTTAVSNLTQNFIQHESFFLFSTKTNLAAFDAVFPAGGYSFNVQAANSNQVVPLNFPSTLAQPPAPHVSNFAAAQAVNPSSPFVLTWDAFSGGGSTDFVYVVVGDVFSSTNAGQPGALAGTATSITIPAGVLQPNTAYDAEIGFYHLIAATNGSSYATLVYRATLTDFTLQTGAAGGVTGRLILTNSVWTPTAFSFDVLCTNGQAVTVQYRTNLSAGPWQTLLTTNSTGNQFHAVAPQAASNRFLFFRARSP